MPEPSYTGGLAVLWVYDYLLTLGDEVEATSSGITEMSLKISHRSGTREKQKALPVRNSSRFPLRDH